MREAGSPYFLSDVLDGLSVTAEIGGTVYVPHRQGEVKVDEGFGVGRMWGGDKGKAGGVFRADPDVHVRFWKVGLGKEDQAKGGILPEDVAKEARKNCIALGGGLTEELCIDPAPLLIVDQ